MTRFMIDIERAMDCVEIALTTTGYNIIPNLKSFKVKDLFELYSEKFGLKWKKGNLRISEKLHEQMISPFEIARTTYNKKNDVYLMNYTKIFNETYLPSAGLSSENHTVSKKELDAILKKYNYFEP